jgi:hypothetical protein
MPGKCHIFDGYLDDDIISVSSVVHNTGKLIELKNAQGYTTIDNDIWYPVFIDTETNAVGNSVMSSHGLIQSTRLGIEFFTSFNAGFDHWETDGSMSIDWILNNHNIPYPVYYGLMFWFKKYDISNIYEDDTFLLEGDTNIWIPDGDVFGYEQDVQARTLYRNARVPTKPYIGMGVHKYYRDIHNALTIKEPKTTSKSVKKSRIYKNIAAYLATSPFASAFPSHAILDGNIQKYINTAINSDGTMSDIRTCLLSISTYFKTIGLDENEIQRQSIGEDKYLAPIRQTLTNNYIASLDDLYKKCINKYGANLILGSGKYLKYKKTLPNHANFECVEFRENLAPSNLSNSKIFINQEIDTGFMRVHSDIREDNTSLRFFGGAEQVDIPLAEIAKPGLSSLSFVITMGSNYDQTIQPNLNIDISSRNRFFVASDEQGFAIGADGKPTSEITLDLSAFLNEPLDFTNRYPINYNISQMISFNWEIISGYATFAGRFVAGQGHPNIGAKTTVPDPTIKIDRLGPIVVKMTAITPFGTVNKIKTINVVAAGQAANDRTVIRGPVPTSPPLSHDLSGQGDSPFAQIQEIADNDFELQPSALNSRGNTVCICSMNRYAFSNDGIFWPISTNMYVAPTTTASRVEVAKLERYFKFHLSSTNKTQDALYKTTFTTTHGSFVKISRMTLNCTRSSDAQFSGCLSVCQIRLKKSSPGRFFYTDNNRDGLSLLAIDGSFYNATVGDIHDFDSGVSSTLNAPAMQAYGGYDQPFRDLIQMSDLPDHPINGPVNDDTVTQFELLNPIDNIQQANEGEQYKICYPKIIDHGESIVFSKGTFDPTLGWIPYYSPLYSGVANSTSVLKFRPGCRDTISFIGPGLSDFTCSYSQDRLTTLPKVYKAIIELKIDEDIAPEPYRGCNNTSEYDKFIHEREENISRRAEDQVDSRNSHGYRILNKGRPKRYDTRSGSADNDYIQCDEFGFDISNAVTNNNNEIAKSFTYSLMKLGIEDRRLTALPDITSITTQEEYEAYKAGGGVPDPSLYDNRYIDATIDDIEVKLNLFNILNTKDYAFKFGVAYDAKTANSFAPQPGGDGKPKAPVSKRVNKFIDSTQNAVQAYDNYNQGFSGPDTAARFAGEIEPSGFSTYCRDLVHTNSKFSTGDKFLYLMNQEYFSNNHLNSTLIFSDHANKNNVLYNHNRYNPSGVNMNQSIVKFSEDQKILPTVAATGYSESDHIFYRNLIVNNNIGIGNNTFSKFHGLGFFQRYVESDCVTEYTDSITFTLEVEVTDEPDIMGAYENTRDGPALAGYYSSYNQPRSTSPFNSLCNWELILHNKPVPKMSPHTTSSVQSMNNSDALGLIEYGSKPKYDGYNFIADLSGAKHLLPRVNMDAPNTFLSDLSLCTPGDVDNVRRQRMPPLPDFPYDAIIRAMITYVAVGALGSLVGTLTFLGFTGIDTSAIVNYLSSLAQQATLEARDRSIYSVDFTEYYMGSPEKILLNVSKDGGIWYKLEASIFKLANTPALPDAEYQYVLMKPGIFPLFTDMVFDTVSSLKDMIDESFIKNVIIRSQSGSPGSSVSYDINSSALGIIPGTGIYGTEDVELKEQDIVNIQVVDHPNYDGLYLVNQNSWQLLEPQNVNTVANYSNFVDPMKMYNCNLYISINSVFAIGRSFFSDFHANASGGKMIILDNAYSFDIFQVGDTIMAHNGNNASSGSSGTNESSCPDSGSSGSNCQIVTIADKARIIKDGIVKTVLLLSGDINRYSYVSPYFGKVDSAGSHKAIIFKAGTTISSSENTEVPFNRWTLNKTGFSNNHVPDITDPYRSIGSVGDGSLSIDKGIFTNTLQYNRIQNLDELLNNTESMRVKYNTLHLYNDDTSSGSVPFSYGSTGYITGFKVSHDDFRYNFINNIKFNEDIADEDKENFLRQINSIDTNRSNYSMMIVCFEPSSPMLQDYHQAGKAKIDQDFEYKQVKSITDENKTIIQDRIQFLENSVIPGLESDYINSSDDDIECYFANPQVLCPKKDIESALQSAYHERAQLIAILDSVTANVFGAVEISPEINDNGSITLVENYIGNDYYWINIDTEQFCSVADDMTPKVLVETEVSCIPTLYAGRLVRIPQAFDNNICPAFAQGSASRETDDAESYEGDILKFTYKFDAAHIGTIKNDIMNEFPSIKGWKRGDRTRVIYGYGPSLNSNTNYVSHVIEVREIYDMAIPLEETISENWHLEPDLYNDFTIDIHPDAVSLPEPDMGEGSSEGGLPPPEPIANTKPLGYLSSIGERREKPGKVINIFNLDETNQLKVNFRKIPRSIRGKDFYGKIQRYDSLGNKYSSPLTAGSPLIPIDIADNGEDVLLNDMYAWHCFRKDSNGQLIKEQTPNYFKLLNEIEFRAFYGSTDGLEVSKLQDTIEALNQEEMLPFEFGGNPEGTNL